jgi:cation diffusion facilitator CzcD-associated flavoprotein CzcO
MRRGSASDSVDIGNTKLHTMLRDECSKMANDTNVVIVGAGPYGLSLAASLRANGVEHQVFGEPMKAWLTQMPEGMLLKSEGFASNLGVPRHGYSLRQYCEDHGHPYRDLGRPVELDLFNSYGLAFQRRQVPELDCRPVTRIDALPGGFCVEITDGDTVRAKAVVVALGLTCADYIPPELSGAPIELVSHSSAHRNLQRFRGRDVIVIGGGASAIDLAVLLHENGVSTRLVSRRKAVEVHDQMRIPRPLWDSAKRPLSTIGPGWRSLFYARLPQLFHRLPRELRTSITGSYLGPAGGWFMKERLSRVPHLQGCRILGTTIREGAIELNIHRDGKSERLAADHVIAATGFRTDVQRMGILNPLLRSRLGTTNHAPALSPYFESTVPGLYFIGPSSAISFGPVMRFVAGAQFTVHRLAARLSGAPARDVSRKTPAPLVSATPLTPSLVDQPLEPGE